MNNKRQDTNSNTNNNQNAYDNIEAVEQVYPADNIDTVELINGLSALPNDTTFDPQQSAANDAVAYADIYSLDSARMARHERSLERRAHKSQLTDRRSSARLGADGEIQEDRRADNRAANVESIRRSNHNNINLQQNGSRTSLRNLRWQIHLISW